LGDCTYWCFVLENVFAGLPAAKEGDYSANGRDMLLFLSQLSRIQ